MAQASQLLQKLRQKDPKFKARLSNLVKLYLKIKLERGVKDMAQ